MEIVLLFKMQASKQLRATDENRPDTSWKGSGTTSRAWRQGWGVGLLTGNGSQVQVVPDHLLQFMVQGALLKLQAEVVTQIGVQHLTCREGEKSGSQSRSQSALLYKPTNQQITCFFTPSKTGILIQTHNHKHIVIEMVSLSQ